MLQVRHLWFRQWAMAMAIDIVIQLLVNCYHTVVTISLCVIFVMTSFIMYLILNFLYDKKQNSMFTNHTYINSKLNACKS